MQIAVWNTPPAEFMVSGVESGAVGVPVTVERQDAETCTQLLQKGLVDVALLPSLLVFSQPDLFDALPGVALSTWKYPYARLVLREGLAQVRQIVFDPLWTQEALVARIVLKEHYGLTPVFVPGDDDGLGTLAAAEHDAALVVGEAATGLTADGLVLDLSQEWFELTNYPMVWGLFAARKDEATPPMVETLLTLARNAEAHRTLWMQAREMTPELHTFFAEDIRLRFDDLATASLTELAQYLYYYNITEDVPELPLYLLPDDDFYDDEQSLLL